MTPRFWIFAGAIVAASGIGLGAYASHGLEARLKAESAVRIENAKPAGETSVVADAPMTPEERMAKQIDQFKTGVTYQMYHGLALFALGILGLLFPRRSFHLGACCWLVGVALFSGLLYTHVLMGSVGKLIHLVPIGGGMQILGWVFVAFGAATLPRPQMRMATTPMPQPVGVPQQAGSKPAQPR